MSHSKILRSFVFAGITAYPLTVSFAQSVSFTDAGTFQVGQLACVNSFAITGDFDRDGILDLVVANANSNDVSVLLGLGDGTFGPQSRFSAGIAFPQSVAAGDFDRDGILDLAVVGHGIGGGAISVLLGLDNGTFGPGSRFPPEVPTASSVAVGDFDRDGFQDLAVTLLNSGAVSVVLGLGNGGFGPETRFDVGGGPEQVAVGDFDGDGIQDLVVANSNTHDVSVLLGLGDGTFGPQTRFTVGSGVIPSLPISVAGADFNRDGIPDLAVVDFIGSEVSVLLGLGDGSFGLPKRFNVGFFGASVTSVSVGDFNGDGHPDLATSNGGIGDVSVLLGVGDGTFLPAVRFGVGAAPRSVVIGDFDRDNKPDLALFNTGDDTVSILRNTTSFIQADIEAVDFEPARSFLSGLDTESLAVGDFNRDGKLDVATANRGADEVRIFLGDGMGSFVEAPNSPFAVQGEPRSVATGDFNRDGKLDVATANFRSNSVSILLGDGNGSFNPALNIASGDEDPRSLAVGDTDRDGILDLVVAHYFGRSVRTLLGNGSGSFSPPADPLPDFFIDNFPTSVALADLNRNGILDLAIATEGLGEDDAVAVRVGDGTGSFGIQLGGDIVGGATFFSVGFGRRTESVAVGDLDRDGILDLVTAAGGSIFVTTLLGLGDFPGMGPLFGSASDFVVGNKPFSVVMGDFNRDGILDLAAANFTDNTVGILAGDGSGSFLPRRNFDVGAGPSALAIGDFNRDGRPDLAVANQSDGTFSILLSRTPDVDNDGITDEVDTEPTTASNDFSDEGLGGTTTGTITDRGDQLLTITEEPNPEGVRITADPSGGPIPATISVCGGTVILSLSAGDSVVVTCGTVTIRGSSVTIRVIRGDVDVEFTVPDQRTTMTLPAGNGVIFDPTAATLTALLANVDTLLVVVDGTVVALAPGETVGIDGTPPVIIPPPDVTVEATGELTTVALGTPTVTDAVDPAPNVINDAPAAFPLGFAIVTWTATDASGNSASATQQVTVQDTTPPVLTVPAGISVECDTTGGATISNAQIQGFLNSATASDLVDPAPSITHDAPTFFPLSETLVTFTATDFSGNSSSNSATITVGDTTAPIIESLTTTPNGLWPPDHKMVPVTVSVSASDVCDAAPACRIISVTSNEPVIGRGAGRTTPDWEITGDLTVNLRAERSGRGSGRVYTVTVRCTDASGNSSTRTVTVTVPHDQREPCVADLDTDWNVGVPDLLLLLAAWGTNPGAPADVDGDGFVGVPDLLTLIANFGPCPGPGCPWDIDGDGVVGPLDLQAVNQNPGPCQDPGNCPWDVNGDGVVDGLDAAAVAGQFGPCP